MRSHPPLPAGTEAEAISGYPEHWEADVVLADGGTAHVRPIVPADAQRWSSFISRLSPQTIYFRFFSEHPRLGPAELEHFTHVDYVGRVAFVALLGDDIVGVGRYDRIEDSNVAEVAFVIEDRHQGRGLGSILLEHLAAAARERGLLASKPRCSPRTSRCCRSSRTRGIASNARSRAARPGWPSRSSPPSSRWR